MCAQAVRRVWAAFHRRGHHAGRLAARRRLGLFLLTFCTVGWRPAGGPASAAKPKLSDLVPEHRTRAVLLAAAQRGDTIAGVQPHKIKGTGQRVYVLELEEDFAVRSTGARSRWGIRGNPRGDEPYIHAEELRTIPADAMVWIKRLTAEEREAAHGAERYSREVEEVGGDAPRGRRMLGLTPEGVVWIANRSHRKLSDLTENNFVLKDPGGLAWYQDWQVGTCGTDRECRQRYAGYVREYGVKNVPTTTSREDAARRTSAPFEEEPEELRTWYSMYQADEAERGPGRQWLRNRLGREQQLSCPADFRVMSEAQVTTFVTTMLNQLRQREDRPKSFLSCAPGAIPRDQGANVERSVSWAFKITELATASWVTRAGSEERYVTQTCKAFFKLGETAVGKQGVQASQAFFENMLDKAGCGRRIPVPDGVMKELSEKLFKPYASQLRMEWGLSDAKYSRFGAIFKTMAERLSPAALGHQHGQS
jgi:hypothetical protein